MFPCLLFLYILTNTEAKCDLLQIALIQQCVGKSGRIVLVGDRCQAIYAWRNAQPDLVWKIAHGRDCHVQTLSTCFRCSHAVVQASQLIMPIPEVRIHAQAAAPVGNVCAIWLEHIQCASPMHVRTALTSAERPVMIIARRWKALFPLITMCAQNKIPVRITAQTNTCDWVTNAIARCEHGADYANTNIHQLIRAARATEDGCNVNANPDEGADIPADVQNDILAILVQTYAKALGCVSQQTFLDEMQCMYKQPGPVFGSVHAVKGGECHNVWLVGAEMMPAWPNEERNILYVAFTRARVNLTLVCAKDNAVSAHDRCQLFIADSQGMQIRSFNDDSEQWVYHREQQLHGAPIVDGSAHALARFVSFDRMIQLTLV